MNILQSNEIYTLPSGIEGRILSVRTESPLDYMLLSLYIHSLEENPLSPIRYLGIEENKPAYGASTKTYKFAVPLSLLQRQEIPIKEYLPLLPL